jgi:carbon starvation protein
VLLRLVGRLGDFFPVVVTPDVWRIFMTFDVVLASAIPVWLLRTPRDFVNVQILYAGLLAVVAGLVVRAACSGRFPLFRLLRKMSRDVIRSLELRQRVATCWEGSGPCSLSTVSCGAISGFHCLVSSGTVAARQAAWRAARSAGLVTTRRCSSSFLAVAIILTLLIGLGIGRAYPQIAYAEENPVLAIPRWRTGSSANLALRSAGLDWDGAWRPAS